MAGSKQTMKRSPTKRIASRPLHSSKASKASLESGVKDLIKDLARAIKQRKYDEVEEIGNILLDSDLSEEADRHLHDIIGSANTIRDAEDEITYQFEDLKGELDNPQPEEEDGL